MAASLSMSKNYARAMELSYRDKQLYVGSMFQIWRLDNMLKPGQSPIIPSIWRWGRGQPIRSAMSMHIRWR